MKWDEEIKVIARVRAVDPQHAYLDRMELLSEVCGVRFPTAGWLVLPIATPPQLRMQLEQACKDKLRLSLSLHV